MKREKSTGPRTDPCGAPRRSGCCDFNKPRKRAYQKERLSPTSKARREASRNEFMVKGGMPDRAKSFREIDSREDRPRARPRFVKPIRNGLRKIKNLINCRSSRAETGLTGRENGIRFQKEE